MNTKTPVAFVKTDFGNLSLLKVKPLKAVSIWYKDELFEMTMIEYNDQIEQKCITISNYSSLPVFFIDANGLITVYQESNLTIKGKVLALTSIEASQKDFFIKDLKSDKFYGVLS